MKKAYEAPAVVAVGSVVQETLSGSQPGIESPTSFLKKRVGAGGVGFYL